MIQDRALSVAALALALGAATSPSLLAQASWAVHRSAPAHFEPVHVVHDPVRSRIVLFEQPYTGGPVRVWELDSDEWFLRTPLSSGPIIADYTACWDPKRQRCTLTDGAEVWTWDGIDWALQTSQPALSGIEGAAISWDGNQQGRLLRFGGSVGPVSPTLPTPPLLDGTWVWDGAGWSVVPLTIQPSPRADARMVWDSARNVVVLFGGFSGYGPANQINDTWEWDGASWTQVHPGGATAPVPNAMGLAYDVTQLKTVAVVPGPGFTLETWEWDGTTWTQNVGATLQQTFCPNLPTIEQAVTYDATLDTVRMFDATSDRTWDSVTWTLRASWPSAYDEQRAIVYDEARQRLVAVGQELWEWDHKWFLRQRGTPFRFSLWIDAAYDKARAETVVFSESADGASQETWAWDGTSWTQRVAVGPSPTSWRFHSLFYDEARGEVILFGGFSPGTPLLQETWAWDGVRWTQLTPLTSPPVMWWAPVAYDSARRRGVLLHPRGGNVFDTWEWDGANWQLAGTVTSSGQGRPVVTYDAAIGQVILTESGGPTLAWDGSQWTSLAPDPGPQDLWAIGHHSAHGVTVGWTESQIETASSSWLFGTIPVATVARRGTGCASPAGLSDIAAFGVPSLGSACAVDLVTGPLNTVAAALFATAPATIPLFGCELLVDPNQVRFAVPMATTTGVATLLLPVPDQVHLLGGTLSIQAAVADPQAPAGLTLTSALDLTMGL